MKMTRMARWATFCWAAENCGSERKDPRGAARAGYIPPRPAPAPSRARATGHHFARGFCSSVDISGDAPSDGGCAVACELADPLRRVLRKSKFGHIRRQVLTRNGEDTMVIQKDRPKRHHRGRGQDAKDATRIRGGLRLAGHDGHPSRGHVIQCPRVTTLLIAAC